MRKADIFLRNNELDMINGMQDSLIVFKHSWRAVKQFRTHCELLCYDIIVCSIEDGK